MVAGIIVGVALFITGWLFAFLHDEPWAWHMMILITVLGVLIGVGFAVTKSLGVFY